MVIKVAVGAAIKIIASQQILKPISSLLIYRCCYILDFLFICLKIEAYFLANSAKMVIGVKESALVAKRKVLAKIKLN